MTVSAQVPDPVSGLAGEQNPFLRYRERLDSYQAVRAGRLSDERFVDIVGGLNEAVGRVVARVNESMSAMTNEAGFRITTTFGADSLVADTAPHIRLSVKVDYNNVAGSHKARHLFGVALHMLVDQAVQPPHVGDGPSDSGGSHGSNAGSRLAIASCGNAAIAAATIARALDRKLDVFVPMWADESVLYILDALGASVNRCERRPGEAGDPAYLRFREAVTGGASPFSVQGTDTPATFDGGRTLGWEIAEQLGEPDSIYLQVGGGALATAVAMALPGTRVHPVQAEGCAPLARAWDRLEPNFDFETAATDPDTYMEPWPDPQSLATGILDDITYDWLPLLRLTKASGGHPIVAPEALVEKAWHLASAQAGQPTSPTGTAGLAGLLAEPPARAEHVVVVLTGVDWTSIDLSVQAKQGR